MLLWFLGLLCWNLGALRLRSPSLKSAARAVIGAAFVGAALLVLYAGFPGVTQTEFSTLAIATFLAAFAADFLVGEDVRRRIRR